jgi:TM2 domain-containing membrane protein YozV
MFCRNCGEKYATDEAETCVKCGCQKGTGTKFCANCGQPVQPGAAVCLNCGASLAGYGAKSDKSKLVAGLLGIFLGQLGIHNFYLGYTKKAVIQLVCTIVGYLLICLGVGALIVIGISIWGLVEGVMILCGKIDRDGKGQLLKD